MATVLNEVQAAARAGFTRVSEFAKARKKGLFPPPAREIPGTGPVWMEQQIDHWLGQTLELRSDRRHEALARLG